ncbi:MAG TPA: SsrA-binding protein SmpB [Acidimicrobiales bacterium]|nr:SsrA-binding protein SmpB [Acidimicrobiales bacterium]
MATGTERGGRQVVASNRRARYDFDILDTYEAGIVLQGSEVKSLRTSKVQLADSYAYVTRGEAWLKGVHIAPYSHSAGFGGHDPERERKLLLHRNQIDQIARRVETEHLTLVPLAVYFTGGRAKLELALARGRKRQDKRRAIAERDARRDVDRAMAGQRVRR